MKTWLMMLWVSVAGCLCGASADQPSAPSPGQNACQVPDNRILGPRMSGRPLPLLSGDATRGFRPACSVPWSTLSPDKQPLPVVGCYQDNLLQVANDAACGPGTGRLWVSIRWVQTSGEQQRAQSAQRTATTCQRLETGTYAATRDFPTAPCTPSGTAPDADANAPRPAPAAVAPNPATPTATATTPATTSPAAPGPQH
jgi:hypothetical protein